MSQATRARSSRADDARMARNLIALTGLQYATADLQCVAQYRATNGTRKSEPATFLRVNRRALRAALASALRGQR